DGMEATRQIRAQCPGVRVIGLSMYASREHARAMQDAGAAAYLTKSTPAEELLAAIRGKRTPSE
ncbi:MAG TPA: response regulator transcription factor, partial [Candidatus Acidoferrum sp.]|nr:response regulator transcription factor [Candidatus Acidoferrum sp.]